MCKKKELDVTKSFVQFFSAVPAIPLRENL